MSYHDTLYAMCEDRAGMKCCRASVRAMRLEQARLKHKDKDCLGNTHPMSLACPGSYNWCSYRSVEEVRGGAARGNSIYDR